MKKLVLATVMFAALLGAAEIHWAENFESALEKAKKENKPVYMLVTGEYCRWCQRLKIKTLSNEQVTKRINRSYIALDIVREKDTIPSKYHASMVPTTYFLAPDGSILVKMPGYWSVEDYLSIMDDADNKFKKYKRSNK